MAGGALTLPPHFPGEGNVAAVSMSSGGVIGFCLIVGRFAFLSGRQWEVTPRGIPASIVTTEGISYPDGERINEKCNRSEPGNGPQPGNTALARSSGQAVVRFRA